MKRNLCTLMGALLLLWMSGCSPPTADMPPAPNSAPVGIPDGGPAPHGEPAGPATEPDRYARSLLRGEALALYDALSDAAEALPAAAAVPLPPALSDGEVGTVIRSYLNDHPEHFDLTLTHDRDRSPRAVELAFHPSAAGRLDAVERRADAILEPVREASEFGRALHIYDYLATHVDYDGAAATGDNTCAYGALMGNLATCDGYARAFQYLCHRAGLDCLYIQGQSFRGVPHAWNLVRIDGHYAYADTTWARPLGPNDDVYHDFFLMSEEAMLRERRPDPIGYALLPGTSGGDYYTRMGYAADVASPTLTDDLADIFLRQLGLKVLPRAQHEPVFLEVGILGDASDFEAATSHFVEYIFALNQRMRTLAAERGLPFDIAADVTLACDFNATTRVITFYPYVQSKGDIV